MCGHFLWVMGVGGGILWVGEGGWTFLWVSGGWVEVYFE